MALPTVCISLGGHTIAEILKEAEAATAEGAELIEIRFDRLYSEPVEVTVQNQDGVKETSTEYVSRSIGDIDVSDTIEKMKSGIAIPVLFTCRAKREGGQFPDKEEATRIKILEEAINSEVTWVDIELSIDKKERAELLELAQEKGVSVVASRHTGSTPESSEIVDLVKDNSDAGDVIKLCFKSRSHHDALQFFEAAWNLRSSGLNYAIMGDGTGGDWPRFHAPLLNQSLVYSTLRDEFSLADEGLVNINDLQIAWEMMGHTK